MSDTGNDGEDPERTAYWLGRWRCFREKVEKGESDPFTTQENAAFVAKETLGNAYWEFPDLLSLYSPALTYYLGQTINTQSYEDGSAEIRTLKLIGSFDENPKMAVCCLLLDIVKMLVEKPEEPEQ